MRLPIHLLLFLLNLMPSQGYSTPSHAIKRLHNTAIRHSAGLARDLRIALQPILVAKRTNGSSSSNVYCITSRSSKNSGGGNRNGTGPGNGTNTTRGSATSTAGGAVPTQTSPWTLIESHQGNNFFDGWDFSTRDDPTHGLVQFVSENTGRTNGLVQVNDQGHAVMGVETTPQVTGGRQSIRITTQSHFDGGLVIMDATHMPTGCGTWPAFWTNGPNWPAGGEIDIIEGVNNYTNNQATIHTDPGCSIANPDTLEITGNVVGGTNCAAAETGNQGCGVRQKESNSFGLGFNQNGGGVYAMRWDNSGIAVYFFPRGETPSDIDAGAPRTSGWGTPVGFWPAATCDPFKFFSQHSVIFDTTLCGDWAGSAWSSSGIPGQEASCKDRTGFPTCEAYVRAGGEFFKEAYWEVKSVKIYQLKDRGSAEE